MSKCGGTSKPAERESVFKRAARQWPEIAPEMRDLAQVEHALLVAKREIAGHLKRTNGSTPSLTHFARDLAGIGKKPA
jgi:hypothetical protein